MLLVLLQVAAAGNLEEFMKLSRSIFVAFAVCVLAGFVQGQGSKPAGQTAPAKPMPGQGAKIGTPYRMGKKGDELHFTLLKAEFATRFFKTDDTVVAQPDHRLLIVTFAVQNPANVDRQFDGNSFKFTIVSPDDENFVTLLGSGIPPFHPDRRTSLGLMLKPAQKIQAVTYAIIHPQGPVNKLIVERGTGNPVLRYDLHDQVKPLAGPFAIDKGLGSANQGAAVMKVPFELGPFDFTVDSMEELPPFGDHNPGDGKKIVAFHMILDNVSMLKYWSTGNYRIVLYDEDGDEMNSMAVLKNSTDENFFTNPDAGAVLKFRVLFYAPAAAKLQKLVLFDSGASNRSIVIPLAVPGS
jgi:hypothetical protein